MSRLVDFQITVGAAGLSKEQRSELYSSLFPIYEAIRLWIKDRKIIAPFRKIVISLEDLTVAEKWHGNAVVGLGICEVREAISAQETYQRLGDNEWVCCRVLDGLVHIYSKIGWQCESLSSFVREIPKKKPPCEHRFMKLEKKDRQTGIVCEVLLEADLNLTTVKLRFSLPSGFLKEEVIAQKPGPLFIEYDFPLSSTKIVGESFVVYDKKKMELARVTIPKATQPESD